MLTPLKYNAEIITDWSVEEAIDSYLSRLGLPYHARGTHKDAPSLPIHDSHRRRLLIYFQAHEKGRRALIWVKICYVPATRWLATALKIAEINATLSSVAYSLTSHHLYARAPVELAFTEQPGAENLISRALKTLMFALQKPYIEIMETAFPTPITGGLEQQINQLLDPDTP